MTEQFITSKDGIQLYTREWGIPHPKAVIALIHGFGEHINRYNHMANFYNKNGYAVVGLDTRGHGKSEGKRGHTPQYETYMDDIDGFINNVKERYKGVPMFLYGHSMGGNLVLNFILKRPPTLAGAIVTGPWIKLAFEPKPIMITLGKIMRSIYPTMTQGSGLVASSISSDPSVVEAYVNDPLVHSSITASAGMALTEAAAWLDEYSGNVPMPLVIMHGMVDKLTSQSASEAFFKRVNGDVKYKKWEGMYHEVHNEPNKMDVFNYTLGWLDSKI